MKCQNLFSGKKIINLSSAELAQRMVMVRIYEPVNNKTFNKTSVTNKDLDPPVHPPSVTWVLVYPSG